MRSTWPLAIGAVLLLPLSSRAQDSDHDRLARGEVLITVAASPVDSVPIVTVRAVISAPPEHVWPIIDQCGRYKETMVRIKESRELSRVGDHVRCEVTIGSPWPIHDLHGITLATITVAGGRWVRAWKQESGDYTVNDGSWTLRRFDGDPNRTLAEYRFHSKPKIWLPEWAQQFAVKHALPDLIDKIRSEVR